MRARDLRQNSARDGETSGRPADKERTLPAAPTIAIDQEAQDQALKAAAALASDLDALDNHLEYLGGFFGDDHPLATALLGSIGITATEIRQQLPALKQAIRDIPLMDGESS